MKGPNIFLLTERQKSLDVRDNLQKEPKAYSKGGLIFRANPEKARSQKR